LPIYQVDQPRALGLPWLLLNAPPGLEGNRPPAQLTTVNKTIKYATAESTTMFTIPGTGVRAFIAVLSGVAAVFILYAEGPGLPWKRVNIQVFKGSYAAVWADWPGLFKGMNTNSREATFYAILVNSTQENDQLGTQPFLATIQSKLPYALSANFWVYNNFVGPMNFGIDSGAFAGEV